MATILVIDDEEGVRYAIRAVLESQGHVVAEADTGATGLRALATARFDLVICDIIMPDKDGVETIVEIRECLPGQKIVAMSGGGRFKKEEYLTLASAVGATHTVMKPFDAQTLTDMVDALLADQDPAAASSHET
jgi:DNA-binding NarL/FixJ family response regulator